jgi:hypothetical protein
MLYEQLALTVRSLVSHKLEACSKASSFLGQWNDGQMVITQHYSTSQNIMPGWFRKETSVLLEHTNRMCVRGAGC